MSHINRFTVDVVTDEPMSEHRQQSFAGELSEWAHTIGVEAEDEAINVQDKYVNGHTHDTVNDVCRWCTYHSQDSKNGAVVAGE